MKVKIFLRQKASGVYAEAFYEDGMVTVIPGGRISETFAEHIQGGKTAKRYRDNSEYVKNEEILKECTFKSPSTAAQFVTGRSTNGYVSWKVEEKKSLGDYLKEQGLRD